jgi:hypothetical protein
MIILNNFTFYIFIGCISLQLLFSESPLSDRYHTYDEIDSLLHEWDQLFGESGSLSSPYPNSGTIYKLMEIGTSTLDEMPFWAVKLSFNANIDEDEPRVLILGQCHAEEILGVEISMELIYRFLHPEEFPSDYQTLAGILYSSEVWIVPTYNPEGLGVVHGWEEDGEWIQDVSYRKNKVDANQNGFFDFDTNGYGNDIDGVDLNRNYSLNWIFGDEFLETDEGCPSNPSYVSNYDYYRGEAPFSESEVVAIKNLVETYDFLLSIAYHSSRSGCVAERVIYSWLWTGPKLAPDYQVIQPLGQQIAELTLVEVGDGNYHFAASGSMRGNAHDWIYSQTGCIQYLIEVGTDNMQPDDVSLIENTIERNLPGAFYLMKRAAGINYPTGPDKYQMTGIVSDAISNIPIEGVEVIIDQMDGGILAQRLTDSFGRYRRLLYLDSFDLTFKKHGYYDFHYENLIPSADIISDINISLISKPEYQVSISIDVPQNHSDQILLKLSSENFSQEFEIYSGENLLSIYEGEYTMTILSEDILPSINEVSINDNSEFEISLNWYDYLFSDDFQDLENWEVILGDWHTENGYLKSQYDLVYPNFIPTGPMQIDSNQEIYSDIDNAVLALDMRYEVEWDNDTLFLNISNEDGISRVLSLSDQNWVDSTYFKAVDLNINSNNTIGLGIISDITIGYRGISVDNLSLLYNPNYDCLKGDLNHDGSILVTDIIILLNIILDNEFSTGFQLCGGDYNIDSNLDILDIIGVLHQIIGD